MKDISKTLIDTYQVQELVEKLASAVNKAYGTEEQLVIVTILKGSVMFAVDLVKQLKMPVRLEFMQVSSYGSGTISSGTVHIVKDIECDISGKNVLILEDIIDSGRTLSRVLEILRIRKPKTLNICTLLDKPDRRVVSVPVAFTGREIPDEFVVGYGLDYNEKYRNLPFIGVLNPEAYRDASNA